MLLQGTSKTYIIIHTTCPVAIVEHVGIKELIGTFQREDGATFILGGIMLHCMFILCYKP